jgi:hypothetical protein
MTYDTETIEEFLGPFLAGYRRGKSAAAQRRIDRFEQLLRDCMEDAADNTVCDDCREMLALERILDPVDAFPRVMEIEVLVDVLLAFVHPPWLQGDLATQHAQWRFVAAAVAALGRRGLRSSAGVDRSLASLVAHLDAALAGAGRRALNDDR